MIDRLKNFMIIVVSGLYTSCIKPYQPPAISSNNHYLVVDGMINTRVGGITTFSLTRTKSLVDSVNPNPELGAKLTIENNQGDTYELSPVDQHGNYASNPLSLDPNFNYRINITTIKGDQYQSDFVTSNTTPPIDSVTWVQENGVKIFINTHDDENKSHYYRWQYINTWEYHSQLSTPWYIANGFITTRTFQDLRDVCYSTTYSKDIIIANSLALSKNLINAQLIQSLPFQDSILNYRLSILVKQFTLSPQAYSYWQIIQKNTQKVGSLFDLQPSQLEGNIHAITNPTEPVVGFLSAGTEEEKRIFINNKSLKNWPQATGGYECASRVISTNPSNYLKWDYTDSTYAPYYFISNGPSAPPSLKIASKYCLDCTLSGGTIQKPSFW